MSDPSRSLWITIVERVFNHVGCSEAVGLLMLARSTENERLRTRAERLRSLLTAACRDSCGVLLGRPLGMRVARPLCMSAIDYLREVTPIWVAERTQHPLRVVDVREPFETVGETGHIPGAESIPLNRLTAAVEHWRRDTPIAIVDADGTQGARAAAMLVNIDFIDVVWIAGGMRAWSSGGFPVAFAPQHEQASTNRQN